MKGVLFTRKSKETSLVSLLMHGSSLFSPNIPDNSLKNNIEYKSLANLLIRPTYYLVIDDTKLTSFQIKLFSINYNAKLLKTKS